MEVMWGNLFHAAIGLWSNGPGGFARLIFKNSELCGYLLKDNTMKIQPQGCQGDKIERRQMIITLNIPESTIVRIEALDKSGRRYDVQGGEFAALIGDYEVEDLYPLPQPDYGDGFQDADDYFELEDCESEFDGYPEPAAGCMAESRRLIPQEIGMRGLDRLLKQRFLKKLYQERSLAYWEVVLSVRMLLH